MIGGKLCDGATAKQMCQKDVSLAIRYAVVGEHVIFPK